MTADAAPAKKAGKPIWPRIPAGFVRSVLAGHSALGLAFAALIYLVCFSGSVAVFAREFQRWEQADAPAQSTVRPEAIQSAMEAAIRRAGDGIEHVYITPPTADLPRLTVMTDAHGQDRTFYADADGRLTDDRQPVWTEFMTQLHINLHLPQTWGMFVVGLTGVALLSSLISGVLAHPRVFKDAFHLRWGGSKRLQEADLHNRLGVWALPFHVIVSLTGALLGLTTIIVGVLAMAMFQGDTSKAYALFLPPIVDDPRPAASLPNLVAALEASQRLSPGSHPTFIGLEHPTEMGQAILINATQPNRLMAADSLYFDGQGRVLDATKKFEDTNLGEKILGSLGPLHFGWYGGLVVKLAYGLLGLALTSVTASGVAIWLARRRDKGRPAPRWERIWIGTVWSQPLAFAASALAGVGLKTSEATLLATWGAVTIVTVAGSLALQPKMLSRLLRRASTGLILAVLLAHLIRYGGVYADPAAWGVNLGLAVVALLIGLSTLSHRTKTP